MGRHKQVSDETVLQAAREVFSENGFGASTREIARQAGVSEAVLYQRHKTKLDLFFAAMIPPPLDLGDPRRPGRKRGFQPELEALAIRILASFRWHAQSKNGAAYRAAARETYRTARRHARPGEGGDVLLHRLHVIALAIVYRCLE